MTEQTTQTRQEQMIWEDFFSSDGWELLLRRFKPRLEGTVSAYDSCGGRLELGHIQGQRDILREIVNLEGIISDEITETLAQAEGLEDVSNDDWRG